MELSKTFITSDDKFVQFNIWVTSYCNYSCRYCYESYDKPDAYMSTETADKAMEFVFRTVDERGCNALWLNFHGGEPMLNDKLIIYISRKIRSERPDIKLYTSATTNCSILCEEAAGYISDLTVSIDGKKKSHDLNRVRHDGTGTYDTVIKNALRYLELKTEVRTRMVVTPNNAEHLSENIIHLADMGFNKIIPGIDYFDKNWNDELFEVLYREFLKVRDYKKKNFDRRVSIGVLDTAIKRKGKCFVGCDGYQITVDGKLYPCTYSVGDSFYEVGDIYNGIDQEAAERINCMSNGNLASCEGCGFYDYCDSPRCRIINRLLTGDHMTPSGVMCAYQNLIIKLHGMI